MPRRCANASKRQVGEGMSVHICYTEPLEKIVRKQLGQRWCFVCRKRRTFSLVVMAPVALSYYGPHREIECDHCHTTDGDCFPGTVREWGE